MTGKAGTGKSALLNYFASNVNKSLVKVAPTGISAMNIGGQTIHSLFKLPIGPIDPMNIQINPGTHQLLARVDVLVIDEISMVRADTIDGIDSILRTVKQSKVPFGGVQILAFGDLFQLPPVVEGKNMQEYFAKKYGGPYFFNALVWAETELIIHELQNVFRQKSMQFKKLLNEVRTGKSSAWVLDALNARVINDEQVPAKNVITLTSTNSASRAINNFRIAALPTKQRVYSAVITGDILENAYPTESKLLIKVDAKVIFVKNDASRRWFNGTLGTVKNLYKDGIKVQIGRKTHNIMRETWEKFTYVFDESSGDIKQQTSGTFKQFPIRLAWAITIHKSQGCSYGKVIIDLTDGVFAHGQTYVALSRCRSLEGMYLKEKVVASDIIVEPAITQFMQNSVTPRSL